MLDRILISQAEGSSKLVARAMTIRSGGHTGRGSCRGERIYFVIEGSPLLIDGDGFIHRLAAEDTVFLPRHEEHHFRNDGPDDARMLLLAEPI